MIVPRTALAAAVLACVLAAHGCRDRRRAAPGGGPVETAPEEAGDEAPAEPTGALGDAQVAAGVTYLHNPAKRLCPPVLDRLRKALGVAAGDEPLVRAVARYQARVDETVDGLVGPRTLAALLGEDPRDRDCPRFATLAVRSNRAAERADSSRLGWAGAPATHLDHEAVPLGLHLLRLGVPDEPAWRSVLLPLLVMPGERHAVVVSQQAPDGPVTAVHTMVPASETSAGGGRASFQDGVADGEMALSWDYLASDGGRVAGFSVVRAGQDALVTMHTLPLGPGAPAVLPLGDEAEVAAAQRVVIREGFARARRRAVPGADVGERAGVVHARTAAGVLTGRAPPHDEPACCRWTVSGAWTWAGAAGGMASLVEACDVGRTGCARLGADPDDERPPEERWLALLPGLQTAGDPLDAPGR